jgi:hypothetical protein
MKSRQKSVISIVLALFIAVLVCLSGGDTLAAPPRSPALPREPQPLDLQPTLPAAGSKLWSSGWVDISTSENRIFFHNLGGDWEDYAVQVWFRDTDIGGYGVNNRAYGSLENNGVWSGVFWRNLTDASISVARQPADTVADQVCVWIWPSQSSFQYCTAWAAIGQGSTVTINHNLGGNVDDYVVKLWFRNPSSLNGVHQIYYGGAEGGGKMYGAFWHGLDTTQVQVTRYIDDTSAEEFLLCVGLTDPPDWDSGWEDILPNETKTLTHNLGVNINRYIVRTEYKALAKDSAPQAAMAIHQFAYGGDASNILTEDAQYMGVNWQNLTNQTIDVYRWANDPYADQVRARIWLRRLSVYLPLVLRNFS